jgi:hypothetical protein
VGCERHVPEIIEAEVGLMLEAIVINACLFAIFFGGGFALRRWRDRRRREAGDETFSDPGVSVEVDCRGCGQFNRVPGHRLRDRPKCGKCKARLMPGKRVVLCRVSPMAGPLRTELNALWKDEDRLWQCLADHVLLDAKARSEAKDPSLHVEH